MKKKKKVLPTEVGTHCPNWTLQFSHNILIFLVKWFRLPMVMIQISVKNVCPNFMGYFNTFWFTKLNTAILFVICSKAIHFSHSIWPSENEHAHSDVRLHACMLACLCVCVRVHACVHACVSEREREPVPKCESALLLQSWMFTATYYTYFSSIVKLCMCVGGGGVTTVFLFSFLYWATDSNGTTARKRTQNIVVDSSSRSILKTVLLFNVIKFVRLMNTWKNDPSIFMHSILVQHFPSLVWTWLQSEPSSGDIWQVRRV